MKSVQHRWWRIAALAGLATFLIGGGPRLSGTAQAGPTSRPSPSPIGSVGGTTVIFDDDFRNGFSLNQWNGTNNSASSDPVRVGALALTTTPAPWQGFFVYVPDGFVFSSAMTLQWWEHGGSAGAGGFHVAAKTNTSTEFGTAASVDPVPAGTWAQRSVPISAVVGSVDAFNSATDRMLWFTSAESDVRPIVSFDQIELVSDSAQPPPTTMVPPTTTVGPPPPPTTVVPPGRPADGTWVIGNYPWYERTDVSPANFPYDKVTHVAIGNVMPTPDGSCCALAPGNEQADWNAFEADVITRAHAAQRKVLLQLGGAGGNPNNIFNTVMGSVAGTTKFADALVGYAKAHSYDGIELDWEENVVMAQVGTLASEIRNRWATAIITVDVDPFAVDFSWVPQVEPYIDRINPMTYASIGNWGGWDGPWHQGALYESADHTPVASHRFSVDRAVQALHANGLPAGKTGFGIGFFGSGYGDSNSTGLCPTSPVGWADEWGAWFADYQLDLDVIQRLYEPAMTKHFDPVSRTPWLSAAAPGAGGEADGWPPKLCYITYEDEQSAREKGQYATAQGVGSIIIWAVPQDLRADGSYPVLDALNDGLR
jgi:GH18 family chitinase